MTQNKLVIQFIKALLGAVLLLIVNQASLASDGTQKEFSTEYYEVVDGKVDPATFVGWSVFHHACVNCHGIGGVGSELAPNLTESVNRMSPEEFRIKVLHQYAINFTTDDWRDMEQAMAEEIQKQEYRESGELETMPHWDNNPIIKENVQNIYRYLKARSEGAIGPGKPGILKNN